jgi:hypothetical protein
MELLHASANVLLRSNQRALTTAKGPLCLQEVQCSVQPLSETGDAHNDKSQGSTLSEQTHGTG